MKLKRFMAIVISLAMVLSIVPAFSLTASAAGTTGVIDALNGEVLWQCPDGSFNDTAIGTAFSGWSSSITSGYVNVKTYSVGNVIQYYVNGTANVTTITSPGYGGNGEDGIIIEWKMKRQNPSDLYFDFSFTDKSGTEIAFLKLDKNYTSVTDTYNMGYPADATDCAIVATNNGDGTHKVEYYVAGSVVYTIDSKAGEVNGFGGITSSNGRWSTAWNHIGFADLTIGSYSIPEAAKDITATYTINGETFKTVTKTIDTSVTDSASFDAVYSSTNGENVLYKADATTLTDSATIAMTAAANGGTYSVNQAVTINNTPYVVKSANLIPNGDFAYGTTGWYGADKSNAAFFTSNGDGTMTLTAGGTGAGGANSLYRAWAIESGKTYLFTYYGSNGNGYHKFSTKDDISATSDGTVIYEDGNAGTHTTVFTATNSYAQINFRWLGSGQTFGNFGLYEVEVDSSKIANTTIKFVDSSNTSTEIADSVTITGIVGDVIDLSAYTGAITYNGNPYSFDSTNPTSYTVVGNNDEVTLTYTTDAYVSFTGTAVEVIQGNVPVLSTTVTAVTGAGSTTVVDNATWTTDVSNLSAGTHTINGTVTIDGNTINGTTTVTVHPLTFTVDDIISGGTVNFPVDVTGNFYVEFDYEASNLDNMWIYISKNAALWGSGQIGLGWDNAGNGYFRAQPAAQTDIQFETGKTYRFFINGDVDSDNYDLTVYDTVTKEVIFTCTDYGFRSASDAINSITASANGEGGVADLTNIKVYAPDQADQFTTVTFTATGSVSDSYTTSYTSAEEFPIPHYDGHIMKTRTVSGSTVTATYEATTTSIGSWYMRNNFTDDNWITQSKYIGSHNAFADDDSAFVNDGGALYGDTGASSTGSTTVSNSQTQSVRVLDQLNAGVRYFDVRLSRQSDGTFATVHGPAFENFRDVAISMAQWAKENPGEVIILDFQTVRDALYDNETYTVVTDNDSYYGPDEGDDNQYVYDALVQLFEDTGLADYMTTNWDRKYGALTSSGTVTAILPFGKGRAVNCQGGYFVNRSALNNSVTYTEESSYSDVVSYLDSTYESLTDGATISTIHAYTTPFSLFGSTDLIADAQDNNPNWINEANFYNWMGYGKGDVLLMNDSVSDIDTYYEALNKFNRTGSTYSYTADFTRTTNDVTITGAQANVPFSTKWTVVPTANTNTYTIDGEVYTAQTSYEIDLMQFNTDSVQPTGDVTVTFPRISTDNTTVDALLSADGTTVYATSEVGQPLSITTASLADVILATVTAPGYEYTVNYVAGSTTIYSETKLVAFGEVVYSVPAGDFYLATGDAAYILNSASAQSHTADSSDTTLTYNVSVTIVSDNAVLGDTFANNDGSADCNNTDNMLFVGSSGISDPGDVDADNAALMVNNGGNVGSPRIPVLTFNVPSVADGKAVKLHLYVAKANQNLEKGSMKLAVGTADLVVDETLGYKAADVVNTTDIVWSDQMATAIEGTLENGRRDVNSWVTVDVTEFVKAATGDTITFTLYAPTAGFYVADREKAVAGGAYEGKAAYMEIVDAYTVTVGGASKITKNGNAVDSTTEVAAYEGATIKLYETSSETPAFTNGTKVYATDATTGETGYITVTADDEYYAATVGVAPVDGAQVRIGDAVDADGKVTENSGLRFITTVDRDNSLANVTGATFGVEITAEGSSVDPVVIPATLWQTEGEVFTSALTNLAVGNFNRKFTATPYVTADDQTFYGTPVTRSIYQVAAGLLNNDKDGTEYPDMADTKRLYDVLNAYVNQTGIRLTLADNKLAARVEGSGAYSGNAFFEVGETTVSGTTYTVTLTPVGENTEIKDYWNEYVRINNNNSSVKVYTTLTDNGDGTYTLTFDTANLG